MMTIDDSEARQIAHALKVARRGIRSLATAAADAQLTEARSLGRPVMGAWFETDEYVLTVSAPYIAPIDRALAMLGRRISGPQ